MRRDQVALAGELLDALVCNGCRVICSDVVLAFLGDVANETVCSVPRVALLLAAYDLQTHAETQLVLAAVLCRHLAQHLHVVGNLGNGIAPEKMDVGMLGGELPRLARAAAEIELGIRLLEGLWRELGLLQGVVFSGVVGRALRCPKRL